MSEDASESAGPPRDDEGRRIVLPSELPTLVGQEIGVSRWFRVDQHRIDDFAAITEDRQWIHIDVERATRELGAPIAHGFLTLSLMSALARSNFTVPGTISAINYGLDRVRFLSPVPAGSSIRLRQTLVELEAKPSGTLIRTRNLVEVEGSDRPALAFEWLSLFHFG